MRVWEENERNWGVRPDGISLHARQEDVDAFIADYWAQMPDSTPDEYSRPSREQAVKVTVPKDMYDRVLASKNGVRLWQHELLPNKITRVS